MKVFVGEFVCGGGFVGTDDSLIPQTLRLEGAAMLQAIVADLSHFAQPVVPLDPRFDLNLDNAKVVEAAHSDDALFANWASAASDCDHAIIVAPESDGVLAKAVSILRASGVDVVSPTADFLRVASDKLLTARSLFSGAIKHPPYLALGDDHHQSRMLGFDRYILKPRDGCGTQAIRTFGSLEEAEQELSEDCLIQPWLPGQPISISLIADGNRQTYLPAVSQLIGEESCSYGGGCGPLNDDGQRRATALASRAVTAIPGTARGFVGLDLLLGDDPSDDCVIEVNPRLTTSYVGLRKMVNGNLAARLLNAESGPVSCSQSALSVQWTPDGNVLIDNQPVSETVSDSA